MSPLRHAPTPRAALYRIARLPGTLWVPSAWPPWEFVGGGRFDDPQSAFRVLYAAAQRRGAFVETLARFRPSLAALAEWQHTTGSTEPLPRASVPADWYQKRAVVCLRLLPRQRWLDLRAAQTREALHRELAPTLLALGLTDLDLSRLLGTQRALTQSIARWAYERGDAGLVYDSRLDDSYRLWAIFEGARYEPFGLPEPIVPDDPDLAATARLFGLVV